MDINEKLVHGLLDINHMMRMLYEGKASQSRILIILYEQKVMTQKDLTEFLGIKPGSVNNIFVHMSGQNIGNDMRKDCFRKIMRFSFPQMNYFGSGSLVTRVTNDITQVQNFVSQFVRGMIRTMMLTFGSIFCMWRLNSRFGLIVLCAFPFLVGTLIICLCKANPLLLQLQGKLDDINAIMQEDISGIRIIKACVREIYEKARFGKANDELIKTQLQTLVIFAFMNPIVNVIMYILRYHTQ